MYENKCFKLSYVNDASKNKHLDYKVGTSIQFIKEKLQVKDSDFPRRWLNFQRVPSLYLDRSKQPPSISIDTTMVSKKGLIIVIMEL